MKLLLKKKTILKFYLVLLKLARYYTLNFTLDEILDGM